MAVRSNWETATGEIRVVMDAQTAHELIKFLAKHGGDATKELMWLRHAISHTVMSPKEGGK